eukprot:357067-Chlamydomonas_euryale.AAC.3
MVMEREGACATHRSHAHRRAAMKYFFGWLVQLPTDDTLHVRTHGIGRVRVSGMVQPNSTPHAPSHKRPHRNRTRPHRPRGPRRTACPPVIHCIRQHPAHCLKKLSIKKRAQ